MIYPQDGSGLDEEYEEQDLNREERREKATVDDPGLTLEFILEDIDKEIAKADSISSLGITSMQNQQERDLIILGNSRFVTLLEEYKSHLENLRDQYLRNG